MADETKIEWSDATLNLWFGCTQLSPACDNCYAMGWGPRLGVAWNGPPKRAADSAFAKIAGYQRGAARFRAKHGRDRRVFINSLSDFFDNQAEDAWRDKACMEMEAAPNVIFILVTKRPQNVAKMVPAHWMKREGWPANVWLLTTAENQKQFDLRVSHLLTLIGPKVLGISMEPMLERITPGAAMSYSDRERAQWASLYTKRQVSWDAIGKISWIIIGGESGRKARPMPPLLDAAGIVKMCGAMGIAVFVKQLSEAEYPDKAYKDYASFPLVLQRREWPS